MRLLIAEDEISLAEALGKILRYNKYTVDIVHDGQQALNFIAETEYDCIVLDVMMPKLDGIQTLIRLRNMGNKTPVIMLTAKSEIDDKVLGLDSGADDYMSKPFSTKELLARLRALTRRDREIALPNIELGNVTLQCTTYELIGKNSKFGLSNKEFQLAEILFRNVGIYLSSERLMQKIWGYDCDSEINVVWTHLSSLRKKLEQLDANIKIKSSRNLGYTLEII
ncbi:MAG: response regulator transcription factor [Bacillota bacterium]